MSDLVVEGIKTVTPIVRDLITKKNKTVLKHNMEVFIKAIVDGKYIQTNKDDSNKLQASTENPRGWERFSVINPGDAYSYEETVFRYGNKISFKSLAVERFVGANYGSEQNELSANVTKVDAWETFTIVRLYKGKTLKKGLVRYGHQIALIADHGEYVMYNKDGDKLLLAKTTEKIGSWETFVLIDPQKFK